MHKSFWTSVLDMYGPACVVQCLSDVVCGPGFRVFSVFKGCVSLGSMRYAPASFTEPQPTEGAAMRGIRSVQKLVVTIVRLPVCGVVTE